VTRAGRAAVASPGRVPTRGKPHRRGVAARWPRPDRSSPPCFEAFGVWPSRASAPACPTWPPGTPVAV